MCKAEYHEYQLYLTIENVEHSKTKVKSTQSNGICERFHRTIQNEFYAGAFRKKLYDSLEALQVDLDQWIKEYNEQRTHSGKYCFGRTPWDTFLASRNLAVDKIVDQNYQPHEQTLPFLPHRPPTAASGE